MRTDISVYDDIFSRYYNAILRYCACRTGSCNSAEDCTQEVFLILYKKIDSVDLTRSPAGWLYKTADNVMKNYRKVTRNERSEISLDNDVLHELPAAEVSENGENFLVNILENDELEIVQRHYIRGEKISDIAENLSITPNMVYKKIKRIKEKIRKMSLEREKVQ